ncbi:hypothetical protein [Bosea sp. (in: a-proteobacteria)]|uniref:hypothetical protein n=1 Tax=Bosea sp. (in: a-proteobacteria) TaxID=1871050 RepID=UPI00273443C6|nr:hypothetical protein [Bosea sp. (in: a-proteobacteria)]MDP3408056.1 hypothetical protein [Bosea sp. (in: a-proteobacteria)]
MTVPLGPQVTAPDRAAQVRDAESGETERSCDLGRPDCGLQREGGVLAGDCCEILLPLGQVNPTQVENVF